MYIYIYIYIIREIDKLHSEAQLHEIAESVLDISHLYARYVFFLYLCHIGWSALFMQRMDFVTPFVVIYLNIIIIIFMQGIRMGLHRGLKLFCQVYIYICMYMRINVCIHAYMYIYICFIYVSIRIYYIYIYII
jgi:hypothetical protein